MHDSVLSFVACDSDGSRDLNVTSIAYVTLIGTNWPDLRPLGPAAKRQLASARLCMCTLMPYVRLGVHVSVTMCLRVN